MDTFDFIRATTAAFDSLIAGTDLTTTDRAVLISALLTLVMIMQSAPETVADASKKAEAFIQRERNAYLH